MNIRLLLTASAAIALLLWVAAAAAQNDIDPEKYAKVKAGMVLNFMRYTTWPPDSFADENNPMIVTVLGRDDMQAELEALVEDATVHGRRTEVRRVDYPSADPRTGTIDQQELDDFYAKIRESHLLYIASSEQSRYRDVLEEIDGEDILTVSDISGFADAGGMLGMAVRRGRVSFDANTDSINETHLSVSSKLLRLATRIVESENKEGG